MNTNGLAKHYGALAPEERFRLIVAASARGDDAERNRLVNAAGRIAISMPNHFGFGQAFQELGKLAYIELLDAAAQYDLLLSTAGDDEDDDDEVAMKAKGKQRNQKAAGQSRWERCLEVTYAAGFILKTKADGWKLFCERLNVPPLVVWEGFPGLDRLQRALAMTEKIAFTAEDMLGWLNTVRPADDQELTEVPLTAERIASLHEEVFRWRAKWWNADADAMNWKGSERKRGIQ